MIDSSVCELGSAAECCSCTVVSRAALSARCLLDLYYRNKPLTPSLFSLPIQGEYLSRLCFLFFCFMFVCLFFNCNCNEFSCIFFIWTVSSMAPPRVCLKNKEWVVFTSTYCSISDRNKCLCDTWLQNHIHFTSIRPRVKMLLFLLFLLFFSFSFFFKLYYYH